MKITQRAKQVACIGLAAVVSSVPLLGDEEQPRGGKAREAVVKAGFRSVPMLVVAGRKDPFFGARAPVIPEARAAGMGNVEWMFDGLRQAIDAQKDSPHQILVMDAGHVPTVKKDGHPVHDQVDAFIKRASKRNSASPFKAKATKN